MKKAWILGLLMPCLLSGCIASGGIGYETGTETGSGDGHAANTQITLDAATEKVTYYQNLVAELEEELLTLKSDLFTNRLEYEARINELETQLKNATAQKEETESGSHGEESKGFLFTVSGGRATLTSYTGDEKDVRVPSHFKGSPVVAIADRAFENRTRLSSIVLPEGVETVGWFAFSGCVSLSHVSIPDSVRSISYGAFLNCNASMRISCSDDSYAARYAQSYGIERAE